MPIPQAVERLLQVIGGRRVGLVTGPTGWLGQPGHLIDILHERRCLASLFAPEHGVWGDLQAGEKVAGGRDPHTGVPVHSLYGHGWGPTTDLLADIDVLVGCLQDAGARPYTFSTTLAACLATCAQVGKPLVVFDRPTPLGGIVAQGNVAAGHFFPAPLPMRPALTIGEQLRWQVVSQRLTVDLTVVPWIDAPRELWYDELGLPWLAPSPNLPTVTSALCFAGTVLLEATNVSEGRGTTRPFELFGAPWCDAYALARELSRRELAGVIFRPTAFQPTFSKHHGAVCHGVQIHVTDRHAVDAPRLGLHVLDALWRLYPDQCELRNAGLDTLLHTAAVREAWQAGATPDDLAAGWAAEVTAWREQVRAAGIGPLR